MAELNRFAKEADKYEKDYAALRGQIPGFGEDYSGGDSDKGPQIRPDCVRLANYILENPLEFDSIRRNLERIDKKWKSTSDADKLKAQDYVNLLLNNTPFQGCFDVGSKKLQDITSELVSAMVIRESLANDLQNSDPNKYELLKSHAVFVRLGKIDRNRYFENLEGYVRNKDALIAVWEEISGSTRVYVRVNANPRHAVSATQLSVETDANSKGHLRFTDATGAEKTYTFYDVFNTTAIDESRLKECDPEMAAQMQQTPGQPGKFMGGKDSTACIYSGDRGLKSLVDLMRVGQSVVVMGYGYSGSGKTTTLGMDGTSMGLIQLAVNDAMSWRSLKKICTKYVFEMYGKIDYQLKLNPATRKLRKDIMTPSKDPIITQIISFDGKDKAKSGDANLVNVELFSRDAPQKGNDAIPRLNAILNTIQDVRIQQKRISPTPNNDQSSRSHLVVSLEFEFDNGVTGLFTAIDLGGSEDPTAMAVHLLQIPKQSIQSGFKDGCVFVKPNNEVALWDYSLKKDYPNDMILQKDYTVNGKRFKKFDKYCPEKGMPIIPPGTPADRLQAIPNFYWKAVTLGTTGEYHGLSGEMLRSTPVDVPKEIEDAFAARKILPKFSNPPTDSEKRDAEYGKLPFIHDMFMQGMYINESLNHMRKYYLDFVGRPPKESMNYYFFGGKDPAHERAAKYTPDSVLTEFKDMEEEYNDYTQIGKIPTPKKGEVMLAKIIKWLRGHGSGQGKVALICLVNPLNETKHLEATKRTLDFANTISSTGGKAYDDAVINISRNHFRLTQQVLKNTEGAKALSEAARNYKAIRMLIDQEIALGKNMLRALQAQAGDMGRTMEEKENLINELRAQIVEREAASEALTKQLEKCAADSAALGAQLGEQLNNAAAENEALRKALENLRKEYQDKVSNVAAKNAELAAAKEMYDLLRGGEEAIKKALQDMENQKKKLLSDMKGKNTTIEDGKRKLGLIIAEEEGLKKDLLTTQQQLDEMKKSKAGVELELQKAKDECSAAQENLRQDLATADEKIKELMLMNAKYMGEIGALTLTVGQAVANKDQALANRATNKQQFLAIEADLGTKLKYAVADAEREKNRCSSLELLLDAEQKKVKALHLQIDALTADSQSEKQRLADEMAKLTADLAQIGVLQKRISELESALSTVQQAKMNSNSAAQAALAEQESKLTGEIDRLAAELAAKMSANGIRNVAQKELESKLSGMEQELQALRAALRTAELAAASAQSCNEQVGNLQEQINTLESNIRQLEAQKANSDLQQAALLTEKQRKCAEEIDGLKRKINQLITNKQGLALEKVGCQNDVNRLKGIIAAKDARISSLERRPVAPAATGTPEPVLFEKNPTLTFDLDDFSNALDSALFGTANSAILWKENDTLGGEDVLSKLVEVLESSDVISGPKIVIAKDAKAMKSKLKRDDVLFMTSASFSKYLSSQKGVLENALIFGAEAPSKALIDLIERKVDPLGSKLFWVIPNSAKDARSLLRLSRAFD